MRFWIGIGSLAAFVVLMILIPFYDSIANHFYIQCVAQGGIPSGANGVYTCTPILGF